MSPKLRSHIFFPPPLRVGSSQAAAHSFCRAIPKASALNTVCMAKCNKSICQLSSSGTPTPLYGTVVGWHLPRRVAEQPGTSHSEMRCDSILHGALGAPGSGCHPHIIFGLQDWADCIPTSISLSSWIQMGTHLWLRLFSSWSFWQN